MGSILDFMGGDHRACDELFAAAEDAVAKSDWDRARDLFARFHAATLHHLAMEEEVLFPAFEARTGMRMGPCRRSDRRCRCRRCGRRRERCRWRRHGS